MKRLPPHIKLIPPTSTQDLQIVLFVERCDARGEEIWRRVMELDWPAKTQVHVVAADERPEVVSWFGIVRFPALAAIAQGALLALEEDCQSGCARNLLEHARHTAALLKAI